MNERVIFDAALEIENAQARKAFVEKACAGNPQMLAAVEELLKSHDAAGSFLNLPAADQIEQHRDLQDSTKDSNSNRPLPSSGPTDKTQIYESTADLADDTSNESGPDLNFLQPSSKPGSIGVLGHYEVMQVLGQGGFGTVLKAFDEKLHRLVAIKVMNAQLAATSPPRKRFLREARAAAKIRHENIVQVYSVEEQPLPYLVMEFIDGQTLQQKQANHGPFEVRELLHIGRQIAAGLASAHAQGLIHRDIKPGNILIEEDEGQQLKGDEKSTLAPNTSNSPLPPSPQPLSARVKITDFGLARASDDASLTQSGMICGTPMYMAPEQATGQALDHRADLFSMGSVLYELATGRPPFRAATTIAVLKRVVDDAPRPMQEIIPELPDWFVAIVAKLHGKNPDDRFQSAKEVALLLDRCQSELQLTGNVTCAPVTDSMRDSNRGLHAPREENRPTNNVVLGDAAELSTDASSQTAHFTRSVKATGRSNGRLTSTIIVLVLALLAGPQLGQILKPHINRWLWPPIPVLAETETTTGLLFDGKDDFVKVGPFDLSSPQYTLEAFVTSASDGDNGVIALLKIAGDESELMYLYDGYPAKERQSGAGITGQRPYQSVNAPLKNGTREHRALVVDGQVMHYFVNGIWQGKRYCTARKGLMWQMQELYIGCKANETEFFRGQIDQLRLSKIARYTNNFTVESTLKSDDSTLAFYNFDEGKGDVLNDASGHGHHGKIVGATWVKPTSLTASPSQSIAGWHGWPADAPPPAIAPFDAVQAKQHQEAWAKYLGVPVEYSNSHGMKFRLIPPGEFLMGSRAEEIEEALKEAPPEDKLWQEGIKSESPQRKVILTQPIYLGVNEVTQAEYEQVMGMNPSYFATMGMGKEAIAGMDTTSHPVETVSWNDAAEFCAKLSQQEKLRPFYFRSNETITPLDGTGYRLPTEAEWEFACRAGTTTRFWIGDKDEDLVRAGWFGGNCGGRTHVVGELKANPFGLSDNHGNVWEWVQDWWEPTNNGEVHEKPALDSSGPSPAGSRRVLRGGAWYHSVSRCRASFRLAFDPEYRNHGIGFRLSLPVDAVRQTLNATDPAMPNGAKGTASKFPPLASGWHGWPADAPKPAIAPFDAEQAKKHQEEWAGYLKVPVEYTNSLGMKFRLIPPGEFVMGSTPEEIAVLLKMITDGSVEHQNFVKSQEPRHRVVLTQPTYLGVHEVTQRQYKQIIDTIPSHFSSTGGGRELVQGMDTADFAMDGKCWNDAAEFCEKLSNREKLKPNYLRVGDTVTSLNGNGYRLPTEALWEFACRAGTTTRNSLGDRDEDLPREAWFGANAERRPHAVGELASNSFGLFDTHGNVWEWVQDVWSLEYYNNFRSEIAVDPQGSQQDSPQRVLRGGSFLDSPFYCMPSHRFAIAAPLSNTHIGFRISISVDAVRQALKVTVPTHS